MLKRILLVTLGVIFCSPAWAMPLANFQGHFDPVNGNVKGILDLGEYKKFNVVVSKVTDGMYQMTLGMEHLSLLGRDVTSTVKGYIERVVDAYDEVAYQGRLNSSYSLISYQPIRELDCAFQIRKNVLNIQSLTVSGISVTGTVGLTGTFPVELEIKLSNVALDNFLNFWMPQTHYDASGNVNGVIKVSGDVKKIFLKGDLASSTGHVGRQNFGDMKLSAMGYYPVVQITKSQLSTTDGMVYSISGSLDFSKQSSIPMQVKALTLAPVVFNSGSGTEWTLKKSPSDQGLSAWKSIITTDNGKRNLDEHDSGVVGIEQRLEF
ncbi:MAG: hypothetical protein HQL26_09005 [Candidatus Omnitrophica bacterium]|nr:hypothetical protein [Candidatus Omnitrophota bacterium]